MSPREFGKPISHEQAQAELGALALGALDPDEERAVLAHVSTCEDCTRELEELRSVVKSLPSSPTAGTLSPGRSSDIRARLLARAEIGKYPSPRTVSSATWLAIAATFLLAVATLGYINVSAERSRLRMATARRDSVIRLMAAELRDRDAEIAAVTGPGVHVMDLSSSGVRAPSARMFWDPATNRWALYARGLPMPKSGRAYELWLVTKDAKIPAGMFMPHSDGTAAVRATYALQPSDLKAIAVTEEPSAGVKAPTGAMVLLGTAAP